MLAWFLQLDRLLRGELTQIGRLRREGLQIPLRGTAILIVVLGAIYGVCMGSYALLHADGPRFEQMLATTVKVPALFLLTLIVTFPSLYVFNALVGSSLRITANLRLLTAALGVTLAVLASLGPITAFFSVSTKSYAFMKLLNVAAFASAGGLGLMFLLQTLHRMSVVQSLHTEADDEQQRLETPANAEDSPTFEPIAKSPLDRLPGHILGAHVTTVFRIWALVFGLVGAQMSWVLRPFIGDPSKEFTWFRPRESNFFESVWNTIFVLFGGGS